MAPKITITSADGARVLADKAFYAGKTGQSAFRPIAKGNAAIL